MRYRYSDYPVDLLRQLLTMQELVKLFLQLVLQTGGDAEEALKWMRYLQERGMIDPGIDLDQFRKELQKTEMVEDRGPIGAFLDSTFGIVFSFRWTGAALACGVMGFPLLVRAIRLSLESIDRKLEDAAATLGASGPWVFATVTLPLALPGVIAGMVLCFAKALGEFGATITFVSNIPGETQTLSAAIYTYTNVPSGDAAAGRLVLVAIAIALAALIASEWFARRAGMRFHGE